MKDKPRLLDLFCGAGGAAWGYILAGFHVTGIDHKDQPRYGGDTFIKADAMEYLRLNFRDFAAIHASSPCQSHSCVTPVHRRNSHPCYIPQLRGMLLRTGKPFVIENVPGSPLQLPILLCGSMFNLPLRRHRLFECSFEVQQPQCQHRKGRKIIHVYGHSGGRSNRDEIDYDSLSDWKRAMGIDWMHCIELAQAIPPVYTQYIGQYLLPTL